MYTERSARCRAVLVTKVCGVLEGPKVKKNSVASVKRGASKLGMQVNGGFLVALHTADVVSGLAIDAAPSSLYLWTFILPTYDDHSFLHMSLGKRVANCDLGEGCLAEAYDAYKREIGEVRSAEDMIRYIDGEGIGGAYARWVKYISTVRANLAEPSAFMLEDFSSSSVAIRQRAERINVPLSSGDMAGARRLLDEWSRGTDTLLGR